VVLFLVDECVSYQTLLLLKELGYTAESVEEIGLKGAKDSTILKLPKKKSSFSHL